MFRIMFVCLGNICRSPMAEFMMKDYVKNRGKEDEFFIKSSATGSWELGNPVHYGTRKILDGLGISCKGKVSELLTANDYGKYDYFICMDDDNVRNVKRIFNGDKDNKVIKLLDLTPLKRDVADPYYTGNFTKTYDDIKLGIDGLYAFLTDKKIKNY